VAVVVVSAIIIFLAIRSPNRRSPSLGDGRSVTSYGFDLSSRLVPLDQIVASGMPRDGLMALNEPEFLSADDVPLKNQEGRGKFLVDSDRVIGVHIGGDARAYPLRLLRWHEVVNDTVGGVPLVVTYNPLCDSVMVGERIVADVEVEFGLSGLLLDSNLLLYDRRQSINASSLWSQLQARAIAGPAAAEGQRLALLPAALSTWGEWRDRHPSSRVLAPVERMKTLYRRDPYHSYFGSDLLRFPVDPLPPSSDLALKDRVVAITVDDATEVLALVNMAAAIGLDHGERTIEIGGTPVTVRFDSSRGTTSVTPESVGGRPIGVRHAFWFAWYAQHPDTSEPLP
jgi:hypothetical protein